MTTVNKKPKAKTPATQTTKRHVSWDDPKARREIITEATRLALIVHRDALKDLADL